MSTVSSRNGAPAGPLVYALATGVPGQWCRDATEPRPHRLSHVDTKAAGARVEAMSDVVAAPAVTNPWPNYGTLQPTTKRQNS